MSMAKEHTMEHDLVTTLMNFKDVPVYGEVLVQAAKEIIRLRKERDDTYRALRAVMRVHINDADHSVDRKAAAAVLDLISSGDLRKLKDELTSTGKATKSGRLARKRKGAPKSTGTAA